MEVTVEGSTTDSKLGQELNAFSGIDVIDDGTLKYTFARDEREFKDGNVEIRGGMLMLVSDVQPMNAPTSRVDTVSGMLMDVRALQKVKTWPIIDVKEEG